jgi:hypothetical protein
MAFGATNSRDLLVVDIQQIIQCLQNLGMEQVGHLYSQA